MNIMNTNFRPKNFSARVVEIALMIPPGRVTTYGRIARAAGSGGFAAQSITSILGKAYDKGVTEIPFHRIVYADGRIWTSPEYHVKRMRLYKKEGIEIDTKGKVKDFEDRLFEFR